MLAVSGQQQQQQQNRRRRVREEDVSEARASVAQPTRQSEPAENMPSHHCGSGRFECAGSRLQRGTRRSTRRHHHTSSSSPLLFLSSLSPVKLHDFTHTHITHSRTCDDKGVKKKKSKKQSQRQRGGKGGVGGGNNVTRRISVLPLQYSKPQRTTQRCGWGGATHGTGPEGEGG